MLARRLGERGLVAHEADVKGALGAGMKTVWFRGRGQAAPPEGVPAIESAEELWRALVSMGLSLD